MVFDASKYESQIRAILQAPGVDLTLISAKRVRKQLVEDNDELTTELVKDHKEEFDRIIGSVYEQVSEEAGVEDAEEDDATGENGKRKREGSEENQGHGSPSSPKKLKKAPKKESLTDAELARQISSELNGRGRAAKTESKPKAKRTKKAAKSKATVNSEGEAEGDDAEKPKKRRGGFTKEYSLSEPLATLLKVERLSRPQVVKHIWDYIKEKQLQNPEDRREIICDDRMKAIFGLDRIGMFTMNKMLGE
ncbi:hypothetical protein PHLCEN_2v10399 [Hermanssonia centrifuga]|uniref:DM2 domain-containing protein n=1 Tax=Hermanssonia centrifuga TaxID=98765 RepID=A0A2R6NMZ2_9APHY|nr:hypothetical protein PHLCEN_2v10399 [Hermanssonia centrifuga]